jgi:hypothetical protein
MLTIENVEIYGWNGAIRGMRAPMNSWAKSDSFWTYIEDAETQERAKFEFFLGDDDKRLASNLANAGTDHGKVLRYIDVTLELNAPLYFWKEFKTYRAGRKFLDDEEEFLIDPELLEQDIEMNSCSTMHKIHAKAFEPNDFSHEHMRSMSYSCLEKIISVLNHYRNLFIESKDKTYWWQMIQLLPTSYNQLRIVKLNYAVLRNMYHARRHHKLDEWHTFCDWIESLPYSELITGNKVEQE